MNYKETINLPKTAFSMKASLARLEPQVQKQWDEMGLYKMIREARAGREKYVLHDGPPYPTGDLHIGTGLNKVLKDFIVRFHTMRGHDAPYVPGWDCHGLPIEVKVLEELGERRETTSKSEIRARCRDYALKYVEVQKRQFKSLGVSGDWDAPYLTINRGYEAGVLEVFAEMVAGGFVTRDLKPVHWCYHCGTVLAEAELEYEDIEGPSIYVNFPVAAEQPDGAPALSELMGVAGADEAHVTIWTTTPWTLPANLAVAVHPQADYVAVRYAHPVTGRTLVSILAEALAQTVMQAAGVNEFAILGRAKGEALVSLRYCHPFTHRISPVVPAQYVTLEDGTGCVHTAPGHGIEDYYTGIEHGLDILSPVDEKGVFTDGAGMFAGRHIEEGDPAIVEHLIATGHMLASGRSRHSYPHCWRCRNPVIFRATSQWFVRMDHDGFRRRALEAVAETTWVPGWGRERMTHMVRERPDWCISRQKSWGVPIPAFFCGGCGAVLLTRESVLKVAEVFAERGSDSWFETDDAAPFMLEGATCPHCGAGQWRKESDIFDVWFESGASHNSVVRKHPDLRFPADLYLEGVDQYRGWFQLSMLPSLAAWGEVPYRAVLTHGFVVDESGRKMSKSEGNFISLEEGVETFRAEILRLWIMSVDFSDQISVSADYIKNNMADAYRRVRNTFRFLLGNVADYDPRAHAVPYGELKEIDRWVLAETARLVEEVTRGFESFEFHRAYTLIHNFCTVQMSSTYLDVLKDRLYCSGADWKERRSAQTVLHRVLLTLCKLCAPVLVHTAEEVWSRIEHKGKDKDVESVHLCRWPEPPAEWRDEELHERWSVLLGVRDEVARAIETLRERKAVANSMAAGVELWCEDGALGAALREGEDTLLELLMVSELNLPSEAPAGDEPTAAAPGEKVAGLRVAVEPSEHPKCARCWNLRPSVGRNADHPDLCERCTRAVSELNRPGT